MIEGAGISWPESGFAALGLARLALRLTGCLSMCLGVWWVESQHLPMYNELSDSIPKYSLGAGAIMPVLPLLFMLGPLGTTVLHITFASPFFFCFIVV